MAESKEETEQIDQKLKLNQYVIDVLEKNGELNKIRSMMRSSILKVIRGQTADNIPIVEKIKHEESAPLQTLNKLILEYFYWFGYQYSIEMFSSETGVFNPECPNRMDLERCIGGGGDRNKNIPILLEIILKLTNK